MEPIIEVENIYKIYPNGTEALRGVSIDIKKGEILGLLGENGAGKTTLAKIIAGLTKPSKGIIRVNGKEVKFESPRDALNYGITMVHQNYALIEEFTVLENIILGSEPRRKGLFVDYNEARSKISELVNAVGLNIPLDLKIQALPVGLRQVVEILKALYRETRVLILDEPTSSLTPLEVKALFNMLRKLRNNGITILFITHRIKEVLEITDRIVVLRKGLVEGIIETSLATPETLAKMMVKTDIKPFQKTQKNHKQINSIALSVNDLWVKDDRGSYAVKGVSFDVKYGEIYCIVGVEGNGQKELIEAIMGFRKVSRGSITISSKRQVGFIPADRVSEGLVLNMSIKDNSILGIHRSFLKHKLLLNDKAIAFHAENLVKSYKIVASNIKIPARNLSGGNQQKLVIARELSKNPELLVAVNPTRGLDIAATNFVRDLLVELRNSGKAILMITVDINEALEISDRIGVIYDGRIIYEDFAENYTVDKLGLLMGGVIA